MVDNMMAGEEMGVLNGQQRSYAVNSAVGGRGR